MAGTFSLESTLQSQIENSLQSLQIKLSDSRKLADAVLRMSDFYIRHPQEKTPWRESWAQISQIAYYLPLNSLRAQAVFKEASKAHPQFSIYHLLDFGLGLGAGIMNAPNVLGRRFGIEPSSEAVKIFQNFFDSETEKVRFIQEKDLESEIRHPSQTTGLFSYSLTELTSLPNWAFRLGQLILIEPATQEDGRHLLQIRQDLIDRQFQILAPCSHQGLCPLLTQSKTDWCHDRIHLEMPDWFLEMERHLPIKNSNLTFSYLVASQSLESTVADRWRIVGDALEERGKTRQMVCRSSEREFLAWLHRAGTPATFERGELISALPFEKKSNELRLNRTHEKPC